MRALKVLCLLMIMMAPAVAPAQEYLPSEKLALNLIEVQPDINPETQVFMAWRGFDIKSKNQFLVVIAKHEESVYAITESKTLGKAFKRKKKRSWDYEKLESGRFLLILKPGDEGLEELLEDRLKVTIVAKSTLFLTQQLTGE